MEVTVSLESNPELSIDALDPWIFSFTFSKFPHCRIPQCEFDQLLESTDTQLMLLAVNVHANVCVEWI